MSFKCGIVGLPNVGKSTLFNALTNSSKAQAANFPFCTIEPNIGIVPVIDLRLDKLVEISKSKKKIYTSISFIPANEIEAIRLEYALASYKIVRKYLLNEKVKGEEINKGTNEELDKLIGKPFNEERNDKCNSFIYDLIPGSKDKIEKLRGTLE